MDKYLTSKAGPGRMLVLLEAVAVLGTGLATLMWIAVGLYGLVTDGLVLAHVFVLLFALPEALILFCVLRRWYDRSRARQIVSLLFTSERGRLTCGELSQAGVYAPAQAIARLTARRYIRNVAEASGEVYLTGNEAQRTVCAYCGTQVYVQPGMNKCPGCGAQAMK